MTHLSPPPPKHTNKEACVSKKGVRYVDSCLLRKVDLIWKISNKTNVKLH